MFIWDLLVLEGKVGSQLLYFSVPCCSDESWGPVLCKNFVFVSLEVTGLYCASNSRCSVHKHFIHLSVFLA